MQLSGRLSREGGWSNMITGGISYMCLETNLQTWCSVDKMNRGDVLCRLDVFDMRC